MLFQYYQFLFFIGCEDITYSGEGEPYVMFEWDARLPIDENGYYHLIMDRDNHQTLHRISGMVTDNGEPIQNVRVTWAHSTTGRRRLRSWTRCREVTRIRYLLLHCFLIWQ